MRSTTRTRRCNRKTVHVDSHKRRPPGGTRKTVPVRPHRRCKPRRRKRR